MKQALFVVECGGTAGLGHLVRSRHLARELNNRGWLTSFVLQAHDDNVAQLTKDWTTYILHGNLKEFGEKVALISPWIDLIVFDLEGGVSSDDLSGFEWSRQARKVSICGTAYEPDKATYGLDKIIIQGVPQFETPNGVLAGLEYVIIDPRFSEMKQHKPGIYISAGGTDVKNVLPKMIESLGFVDFDLECHVAQGIRAIDDNLTVNATKNISFHFNADVPDILSQCHVGLVSYGMSVLECMAAGIPVVTFGISQAHVDAATQLDTAIEFQGHVDNLQAEDIGCALHKLLDCPTRQQELSAKGRQMVDGKGVYRVADVIVD